MFKNWFKKYVQKIKIKLQQYITVENLVYNTFDLCKSNCITSCGIQEIYFDKKNPKRFKLCILNCIISWIVFLFQIAILTNHYLYSLIQGQHLPAQTNILLILMIFLIIHTAIIKTDLLFGEIKYNLRPFKICYFLAKDIKSMHKLSEQNYNKFAKLIRFCFIGMICYGRLIVMSAIIVVELLLLIKSRG